MLQWASSVTANSVRKSISILKDLGFEHFIQLSTKLHFFIVLSINTIPMYILNVAPTTVKQIQVKKCHNFEATTVSEKFWKVLCSLSWTQNVFLKTKASCVSLAAPPCCIWKDPVSYLQKLPVKSWNTELNHCIAPNSCMNILVLKRRAYALLKERNQLSSSLLIGKWKFFPTLLAAPGCGAPLCMVSCLQCTQCYWRHCKLLSGFQDAQTHGLAPSSRS